MTALKSRSGNHFHCTELLQNKNASEVEVVVLFVIVELKVKVVVLAVWLEVP